MRFSCISSVARWSNSVFCCVFFAGSNTISSNASTIYRSSAHSTQAQNTITSISNSVDYVWREQAIFRHALPEGLVYPHLPRQTTISGASHHNLPHSQSSAAVNALKSSTFTKPALAKHSSSTGNLSLSHPDPTTASSAAAEKDTVFSAPNLQLYHPHDRVSIAVFERTFFSDHKLGEVEIPLSELTDKK